MTKIEKSKIMSDYAAITSRLITKAMPIIKKTYGDIELIDLLMGLPITFDFNEVKIEGTKKDGSPVTIKDVAVGGHIVTDTERGNPDRLIVFLTFSKEKDQSWDDYFKMIIDDSYYHNIIAFTYIHEAMHILMKHYDYYMNLNFARIVRDIRSDISEPDLRMLLNYAMAYWINAYLMEGAKNNTMFHNWSASPDTCPYLYDANLSPKHMTQVEIIEKLAKEAQINTTHINDSSGNSIGRFTEITINGNTSQSFAPNGQNEVISHQRAADAEQGIQEVLDSSRSTLIDKTRGNGTVGTMAKLGVDYSVPTDWFKSLKGSVFSLVQKHTDNYDVTWGKLRTKLRHIAPFPGFIYYEKDLAAIISIDQSGSMSNDDLEKINYVVTQLSKKTIFTEIMLHDTKVAERKVFKGKSLTGIKEFVTNRVASGGTSHQEVFEGIADIKKSNPKIKFIYLSFSDNWSDIDTTYDPEIFKGVNSYWITTDESRAVNVPGMQISLEHGLLKS